MVDLTRRGLLMIAPVALGNDLMTSTFGKVRFGSANGVEPLSTGLPPAMYPGAVATNAQLTIAVDRLQTRLAVPLAATDTQMIVTDGTGIVASCLLTIDNEIVQVQSGSGTTWQIRRGFDGTAAALHLASALVAGFVDAWHHNALVSEVQAIQIALGPNLSQIPTSPFLVSSAYIFPPQTPGGNLVVGANVITLTPVPKGVNGSNASHYLYISGGTGTAEAVPIIGGTAISGAASGTVLVTCAQTHSGAWTIQSATAGIQEAIRTVPLSTGYAPGPSVLIPTGKWPIYATITADNYATLLGAGSNSTILQKAFSSGDVIYVGDATSSLSGIGGVCRDFMIQPLPGVTDTGGYAIRIRFRYNPAIESVTIYGDSGIGYLKNGVKFDSCLTFSLVNTKILNVNNIGLEVTATSPNQCTGRIVAVDATSPGIVDNLVYFHGNILSTLIDGLQIQGGYRNWYINTTGGAFSESQISNIVFDSAAHAAFALEGSGSVFKLSFSNIELSTISGQPSTMGMSFDGTGASTFAQITISNLTGGVNASNQIGTAMLIVNAVNFLLSNSNIQGAGAGIGDTAIQIGGTTANIVLTGNVLGYAADGSTAGTEAYRAIYIPSGTHAQMTINGNNIFGTSAAVGLGGAFTNLNVSSNSLAGGAALSFPGTGTAYFDNPNDPPGLNGRRNYITVETGTNNAIAGTLGGATLAGGLRVSILLAHSLQAGANAFTLNGGAAVPIKSSRNPANNLTTAYAVGATITLQYDGTQWVDLSQ